jgi:crotonobetainyl-CoA:carnitine CoA-transferase CaiB-like acyl-CoA transferase
MHRFFARFTARELLELGFGRESQVFVVPTDSAEGVVSSPHLQARGFFVDVEHEELGATVTYPGPPYRMPESPWRISRRAPRIGEHNREVYQGWLGMSDEELAELQRTGVI